MSKPVISNQKSEVRRQALRACATVADVLGRDPKAQVFVGGTGLLDMTGDEGRVTRKQVTQHATRNTKRKS